MAVRTINEALELHHAGRLAEAERAYRQILQVQPNQYHALHFLGVLKAQQGDMAASAELVGRSLALFPNNPLAEFHLGEALRQTGRAAVAAAHYRRSVDLDPGFVPAYAGLAECLVTENKSEEALQWADLGLSRDRDYPNLLVCRGDALRALERNGEASQCYERALAIVPDQVFALVGRAHLLFKAGHLEQALAACNTAVAAGPQAAEPLLARAAVFNKLNRPEEALADCLKAKSLDPDSALAANKSFELRAHLCDWAGWDGHVADMVRLLGKDKEADPFLLVLALDDPEIHATAARRSATPAAPALAKRALSDGRLKVAYISPDFHEHPVAHMTVEVFEAHDRARVETYGICIESVPDSPLRLRLKGAFDHFVEAGSMANRALAGLLHELGIDIAVDLAGYTAGGRTAVLSYRPCPIAVGWLGYPGTTGTSYVDYIVADPVIIPPEAEHFYSEKVVRLPTSYMPRDAGLAVGPCPPRSTLGLPENGFVFSAFNNTIKFNPEVFAVWMRLLGQVEGSVLWLNCQNGTARAHLCREAEARGVAAGRLVFAGRSEERADHLARLAAADLFLDTLPYGAHSTANDMLWMGVPVLTVLGRSFAARVAGGMLAALGLPELIAPDLAAYEAEALALAREPARLAGLRARLGESHASAPLFDSVGFARSLENAYEIMAERHRKRQQPESFSVILPAH